MITFKGTQVHTQGKLPSLGSHAPDFTLVDGELKERRLSEFKGKKKLLYIAPSLDTSVCLISTQKLAASIKGKNAVFLTITADLPFAQKRICTGEHMEGVIPLSTMRGEAFYKDYGVKLIDGPLAGLCCRAVLVLDGENKVIYQELVPEITHEPNYNEAVSHI